MDRIERLLPAALFRRWLAKSPMSTSQGMPIQKAGGLSVLWIRLLLSIAFLSTTAFAQNDVGSIVGFVTDSSGAVVQRAKVTVANEGTGETRTVTTDAQGHYAIPNLAPATYTLTAEAPGFQRFQSTHNTLASNSTISIRALFTVGQETQTVQVTASEALLQTQSGAVQSEVTGEQVQKQELNGRNPMYMTQLVPGVSSSATLGDFNFQFNNGDVFSVNGARNQDTMFTIDGAPATRTRDSNQIIGGVNVDATQEIQVLTADFSAEYGGASGAQVRIVTKSGTKDFHGVAYEYLRNSAMDANTWTRNLAPSTRFASPFEYNNFGFAVGGPIWTPKVPFLKNTRDKLFFFINEDWIRYRYDDSIEEAVPTTLMRQGNFSELLSPNPWYPTGTHVYNPATCPVAGKAGCVAYAGNIIPSGALSPNGIAIIDAYPAPTPGFLQGTNNWLGTAPHPINQRKGQINADFLVTPNNHLEYRHSDDSYFEHTPFNQNNNLVPINTNRPNQINSAGWVWTITPTMINEARFSVSIDDVYTDSTDTIGYNRGELGIDFPYILPGAKSAENKIPSASLPTFLTLQGGPYPSHSSGIIYVGSDSVTKVWRNHTVKGGFSFNYGGENDNDQINDQTVPGGASNQNGTFAFTDARTGLGATSGVGLSNLALGLADSYTEIGPKAYTIWRGTKFEYFIQDSWQVNTKLHLDYGLRFTTTRPPHALWGNATFFDPASYNPANAPSVDPVTGNVILGTGNPYDGVVIPGISQFPASAVAGNRVSAAAPGSTACAGQPCTGLFAPNLPKSYVATTTKVQPRFGIAYQFNAKGVIRAGGGRFLSDKEMLGNIFPGGNSPFQPTITVNNVSVDDPGASVNLAVEPPLTLTTMNKSVVPPTRWNWNATVEQELPSRVLLSLAYVGARGLHNWSVADINQPGVGALLANPNVNLNYLRPYRGFSSIQQEQSGVSSNYNSLQLSLARRFMDGSMIGVAYTFSKSMDNSSNYRDIVPDTYNTTNLWGPSEYDIRHVFIVNYLYSLPFFKGQKSLAGEVLGGWEISGNTQLQTGQPCGVGTNNDFAGVGEYGSFGCGSEGQFWVIHGTPTHLGHFAGPTGTAASAKWFATTNGSGTPIFTQPAPGTFNFQHGVRDNIYGPGLQNWNIALLKSFPLYRENAFEFRAEAYNFINHPNLSAPSFTPTSSQFGEVTGKSTSNPRTLQVGARYRF